MDGRQADGPLSAPDRVGPESGGSLRDEGAGQEAHQADGGSAHSRGPAAQDVCEDADDGRAEEDHPHGERAHPRCKTRKQKLSLGGGETTTEGLKEPAESIHP